jgi:ubiquinone/menaquinone biosynthesis C-methylase UbiE
MRASTDEQFCSALAYPREEIERDLAAFTARRFPLTSPEGRSLVKQETKVRNITARYWCNRLLGWARSRRMHKKAVEDTYDHIWTAMDFANFVDPSKQLMAHEWRQEGWLLNSSATQKLHHVLMIKALRFLRPASVLEVGSGLGINLAILASQCPGTRFHGIELTKSGVDLTRALVAADRLPQPLQDFMAEPPSVPNGFRDVTVDRGSAERLPYADNSFDLVMTRLALEQMESIRERALTEISRVARSYVLMIESFRELNDEGLRRKYAVGNRYFRGAIADLPRYGLEPIFTFSDWPHKITMCPVFVLAKKTHAAFTDRGR